MTWVRISDDFYDHPKFAAIGADVWALWLAGLAYCNRNLTDGFISTSRSLLFELRTSRQRVMYTRRAILELTSVKLWDEVEGGYQVHDYLKYQRSASEIRSHAGELSAIRAAAGRKGGLMSASKRQAIAQAKMNQTSSNAQAIAQANGKPQPQPFKGVGVGGVNAVLSTPAQAQACAEEVRHQSDGLARIVTRTEAESNDIWDELPDGTLRRKSRLLGIRAKSAEKGVSVFQPGSGA